jgi:hypothetical protein
MTDHNNASSFCVNVVVHVVEMLVSFLVCYVALMWLYPEGLHAVARMIDPNSP